MDRSSIFDSIEEKKWGDKLSFIDSREEFDYNQSIPVPTQLNNKWRKR
jgi:hypothetical protein